MTKAFFMSMQYRLTGTLLSVCNTPASGCYKAHLGRPTQSLTSILLMVDGHRRLSLTCFISLKT